MSDMTPVVCRLPVDLLAELRQLAEDNDRNLSAEIRRAVRQYVEANRPPRNPVKPEAWR